MPTITANGIDIAYTLEGDGAETVVLINGLAEVGPQPRDIQVVSGILPVALVSGHTPSLHALGNLRPPEALDLGHVCQEDRVI